MSSVSLKKPASGSKSLAEIAEALSLLDAGAENYATDFVEQILAAGLALGASDLHLQPTASAIDVRLRLNGVLVGLGVFPAGSATNVITRLKILADLLTYRTDVPQEGRLRSYDPAVEMRVSTFPTIHGEKAVVRLFSSSRRYLRLDDLGYPVEIADALRRLLGETTGAILATGPAGSGKTTALYALVRELLAMSGGGRSVATLEDPVEVAVPGIAQSQVNAAAGFDLTTGLRSILRQDPEVIMIGEIRDKPTAAVALQASLTGQLVLSSFHAGSAAGALSRLADMGIEPYVIRSGILAAVSQRLVRRLCECARPSTDRETMLGLPMARACLPEGCAKCAGTGYVGRALIAEMLTLRDPGVARAVLERADATAIGRAAEASGVVPLWRRGVELAEAGITSPAEIRRVLGFWAAGDAC